MSVPATEVSLSHLRPWQKHRSPNSPALREYFCAAHRAKAQQQFLSMLHADECPWLISSNALSYKSLQLPKLVTARSDLCEGQARPLHGGEHKEPWLPHRSSALPEAPPPPPVTHQQPLQSKPGLASAQNYFKKEQKNIYNCVVLTPSSQKGTFSYGQRRETVTIRGSSCL